MGVKQMFGCRLQRWHVSVLTLKRLLSVCQGPARGLTRAAFAPCFSAKGFAGLASKAFSALYRGSRSAEPRVRAPRGALQEVFLTSEYICIVMEYATGGSLFHYVQKQGKLKVRVHLLAT